MAEARLNNHALSTISPGRVAAGGSVTPLLRHKGATANTTTSPEFSAAALGALAYRAYDNWKHHHNEDTEIAGETQFYQHCLNASGTLPQEFELAMVKVMIAAAKADGHIDAEEQRKILVALDSLSIDSEVKGLIFELLVKDFTLQEIATDEFTLPLKAELYLAAFLVTDKLCERETRFLRRLANQLELPAELIGQIQFQARLERPQAA